LPHIHEILGLQDKALWHCAELMSCGLQVQVLLSDSVRIRDRSLVEDMVNSLVHGGREKLQVGTARQRN
jgi:hypothetical protein